MKNNVFKIALLIITGIIYYRIYLKFFGENQTIIDTDSFKEEVNTHLIKPKKEFYLNLSFNDPFLEEKTSKNELNNIVSSVPINEYQKPKKTKIEWPIIKYKGMIKKSTIKSPLAIVVLDNINLLVHEKDVLFDGLIIKKINQNEILISYKKENKYFGRN